MTDRIAAKIICMAGCSQYTNQVDCSTYCMTFNNMMKMAKYKDRQWRLRAQTTFCVAKGCTNKCGTDICDERKLFNKFIEK